MSCPTSPEEAVEMARRADVPISTRMECLFYLRGLESAEAAELVQQCMTGDSVLVDHEVAYVLGQLRQPGSVGFLLGVASDHQMDPIVRHEAIEALGNFGDLGLVEKLVPFAADSEAPIVRESAILAIAKLEEGGGEQSKMSLYGSHDPAYPAGDSIEEAVNTMQRGGLVDKYKKIFYLRDLNTPEAVDALAHGFADPSDLLRHEVAYVFGQMRNPHSVPVLVGVLDDPREKEIVRHEAAEALGNIGTDEALRALGRYLDSDVQILRESARVGLGIAEDLEQ